MRQLYDCSVEVVRDVCTVHLLRYLVLALQSFQCALCAVYSLMKH
jgi:hypothetical protein